MLVKIKSENEILEMRLIAPRVELGDQFKEVSAVLFEDLILLLNTFLPISEVFRCPCRDNSRELGDGAKDVSDYFHQRRSFRVEETSEESSFEILLMDSDEIVQAGNFMEKIVLKL